MTRIMVGTDQGLHVFDGDGTPGRVDHAGSKVTALGAESLEAKQLCETHEKQKLPWSH